MREGRVIQPFSSPYKNHMLPLQTSEASSETPAQQVDPSQPDTMTQTISLPASDIAFLSPKELARYLRVTTDCIYRLLAKRLFPVYRVLRRNYIRRSDIERWLDAHKTNPRNPKLWQ